MALLRVPISEVAKNAYVTIQFIFAQEETSLTATLGQGGKDVLTGRIIEAEIQNAFNLPVGSSYIGNQLSIEFPYVNGKSSLQFKQLMDLAEAIRLEQLANSDGNPYLHVGFYCSNPSVAKGVNPKDGKESIGAILQERSIDWVKNVSVSPGYQVFLLADLDKGQQLTQERSAAAYEESRATARGSVARLVNQLQNLDPQTNAVLPELKKTQGTTSGKTRAKTRQS